MVPTNSLITNYTEGCTAGAPAARSQSEASQQPAAKFLNKGNMKSIGHQLKITNMQSHPHFWLCCRGIINYQGALEATVMEETKDSLRNLGRKSLREVPMLVIARCIVYCGCLPL